MNRRDVLVGVPVVVAFPGQTYAATETPIIDLFRGYMRITDMAEAMPLDTSDEVMEIIFAPRDVIERRIMALPCRSAADLAAKLLIRSALGTLDLGSWEAGETWKEVRALLGLEDRA